MLIQLQKLQQQTVAPVLIVNVMVRPVKIITLFTIQIIEQLPLTLLLAEVIVQMLATVQLVVVSFMMFRLPDIVVTGHG